MKIDNKKYVKNGLNLIITIIITEVLFMTLIFFFKNVFPSWLFVECLLIFSLAITIFTFFKLKVLQVENSGEVLTIKRYFPFDNRFVFPSVELPVNVISSISIRKKIVGNELIMNVFHNDKKVKINLFCLGLSENKLKTLEESIIHNHIESDNNYL